MYLYIVHATSRVHLVSSCYAAKNRTAANPHVASAHTHEGPAPGEKIESELKCDSMLPPAGLVMYVLKMLKYFFFLIQVKFYLFLFKILQNKENNFDKKYC